jgi:hypothetical protein
LPLGAPGDDTFFMRHGMFVGQGCVIATAGLGLLAALVAMRSRSSDSPPQSV